MKQPSLAHVLQPKWRTALQRLREERAKGGTGKLVILALVGSAFWVGVFGVLYRILKALRSVEELGPLIPGKILGLILLQHQPHGFHVITGKTPIPLGLQVPQK